MNRKRKLYTCKPTGRPPGRPKMNLATVLVTITVIGMCAFGLYLTGKRQ